MKTQSTRIKANSGQTGQLTIIAFVFSIILSPVGLILYFYAKSKEAKGPMLTATLIISIIGTGLWIVAIVLGIISWFGIFVFWVWHV